jgi:hypothetical protein
MWSEVCLSCCLKDLTDFYVLLFKTGSCLTCFEYGVGAVVQGQIINQYIHISRLENRVFLHTMMPLALIALICWLQLGDSLQQVLCRICVE